MSLPIDHIFIFSQNNGQDADELVNFGLSEGSSRVHKGQGTINRKFYFENFFLEILWVHNEAEIKSEQTKPTKLWERSNFNNNEYSPFGLCLDNTDDTDQIFKNSFSYQPEYFPNGKKIDFVTEPALPWLFRLPFRGPKKESMEPKAHTKNINQLTKVIFQLPYQTELTQSIQKLSKQTIRFKTSQLKRLILEFDYCTSKSEHHFKKLPLTIKY